MNKKFQFQTFVWVVALLPHQRLKSTFFEKFFFTPPSGTLHSKKIFKKPMILAFEANIVISKCTFFCILAHCAQPSKAEDGSPWQQTPIWSTDECIYGRLSSYLYQFLLWTRTLNWFVSFSQLNPGKKDEGVYYY